MRPVRLYRSILTDKVVSARMDHSLLKDGLARVQREVDSVFDAVLPVPQDSRARLVDAMRYAAIGGGKRVRPLLLVSTAELFGVNRDAALRAACAVEAIHVYSLIHDDLPAMDDDDMRRGQPTLHKAFDEATAILVGDGLQTRAFELIATDESLSARQRVDLAELDEQLWRRLHLGAAGQHQVPAKPGESGFAGDLVDNANHAHPVFDVIRQQDRRWWGLAFVRVPGVGL